MAITKMPWGKHKDTPLTKLDLVYLAWIITTIDRSSDIYRAAHQEMQRRLDIGRPPNLHPDQDKDADLKSLKEFLKSRK